MKRWHSKSRKKAIDALVDAVEQGLVKVQLAEDMADESVYTQCLFVAEVLNGMKPTEAADYARWMVWHGAEFPEGMSVQELLDRLVDSGRD